MSHQGGDSDFGVVAFHGHAEIGLRVAFAPVVVELGEGHGIARQRPVAGLRDAALDDFEGAVQPDADAVVGQQLPILRNGESAAAEREDRGTAAFDPAHVLAQNVAFDLAEVGFAARRKQVGDRDFFGGLDLFVGIEIAPAQPVGQMPPTVLFPAPMNPTM